MNPLPSSQQPPGHQPPGHQPPGGGHNKLAVGMLWLLVLVVLASAFAWLEARRNNPNRNLSGRVTDGVIEVTLEQNRGGHYVATGGINGRDVELVLDTGATAVAIPGALAADLGLERMGEVIVQTANGDARAYLTRLDEVRLGPIVMRDVRAVIQPTMQGEVLLGMTFLRELEMVQRDRTLILRQY